MEKSTAVRFFRIHRLVPLFFVLAFVAAACGGGTETTSGSPSPEDTTAPPTPAPTDDTTTEPEETAAEPASLRVLLSSFSLAYAPILVAEGGGFFEEVGLDVELLPPIPRAPEQVELVAQGEIEIAGPAPAGLFIGLANRRPVVGVAVGAHGSPFFLVLRNEVIERLEAEGVMPDSPVEERVEALRGLSIGAGTAGGGLYSLVTSMLESFGLDPARDVELITAETDVYFAAFREGRIDGLVFSPPNSLQPVHEGYAGVWLDGPSGEVPVWTTGYQTVYVADRNDVSERPDVYDRFVGALARADQLMQDDVDAAMEAASEHFADLDPALYELAFRAVAPVFPNPFPDEEGYDESLEQYNAAAETPVDVPFADAFAQDLIARVQG